MYNKRLVTSALLILALLFSAIPRPVLAAAPPAEPCTTVDFYLYNGLDGEIMFDVINWANYTRWLGYVESHQAVRFTLDVGSFEFWIEGEIGPWWWYISDGTNIFSCAQVAMYVKMIKGRPQLKLKILEYQ